ncbi:class II fructose-bisphosphate aldolase [Lysinibacter cavernae]|uniref:Tagatose 1,6-diphosphate aldolase GatY/KbaY n=1 Tax=Lysinibacter cavernae TaxID=1640652 RepID=A0A7X5TSN1_9MICO|nr:tagatose 1,6-diphosphate aldolase GatY/KbaY [Lysinibacter cavernae]
MRTNLDDLVRTRLAEGAAVPALTCYDFTTAQGVVAGAEAFGHGVILLVTPKTAATSSGLRFIAALRTLADAATVPVSVQLDHATDLNVILSAVDVGVDSVLADGSQLGMEENAEFVATVRRATEGSGIVLEAELGSIEGDEDRSFEVESVGKTDAALVAPFMAASGAHLLAASVGNVHGHYKGEPQLDWELIASIRSLTPAPLSLHGASGLPASDLERAASEGIGKVNINTELRATVLATLGAQLEQSKLDGNNVFALEERWRAAVTAFTVDALARLDSRA